MIDYLLFPLIAALGVSLAVSYFIRIIAMRLNILSKSKDIIIVSRTVPLLGGVAVFSAFLFVSLIYPGLVISSAFIGIIAGAFLLVLVGIIDDLRPLSWQIQLMAQIAASITVILSGTKLFYINNPFGGALRLDMFMFNGPKGEYFPVFGAIFILIWLILFTNTFNWLDGLDGLAGGIGSVAFISLALLSLTIDVYQPPVAIFASIAAGALLGFLFWNFPPARIYLGGSSAAIGFILGAIAIVAGAKVATAFLVFTVPIIDALWVIFNRLIARKSVFSGDDRHLHYRLLAYGWSLRKILFFLLFITVMAGISAVYSNGPLKFVFLLLFICITLSFFIVFDRYFTKKG